jgi:transposase
VVLACAEGLDKKAVAKKLRSSLGMIGKWRWRFLKSRLAGVYDEPPPARRERSAMTRLKRVVN